MSNKANKRSMLVCALTLLLCVSMVVGSTYAWFTDAVAVNDNIIASGELKVGLDYWNEATGKWTMADEPIFNYDKWEPGYTVVQYVKVTNKGDLAFKYEFDFDFQDGQLLQDDAPNLSDVIDVYYGVANVGEIANRADLGKLTKFDGSLSDVLLQNGKFAPGVLKAGEDVVLCIALKMQESAGNEYQNLKVGNTKFDLKLYAEQYTSESDSFGPDYDDTFTGLTAKVTYDGALKVNDWFNIAGSASTDKLDSTYTFSAVETATEAEAGKYANWIADFVVTVDKDISKDTTGFGIAGQYNAFGEGWLGFTPNSLGIDIEAGTPYRLLHDYSDGALSINYYELCNSVKDFRCGVWNTDPTLCGVTMTVELRIYETEELSEANGNTANKETGDFHTIASITYTLGVNDPAAIADALANGGNVVLSDDVDLSNTTITIPAGKTSTLDLNGYTLSGDFAKTGNQEMFLVKGTLTVTNGTVTMESSNNQGWNAMSTVFDVTAGGVLNITDATVENLGGTDMSFAVHLNNWGEVTLNVENSTLKAAYIPVRVFNAGFDMNNVTLHNSTLTGKYAFWVHNYIGDLDSSKHSDEAINARLNFNLYDGTNKFLGASKPATPIFYGFNEYVYFTADGALVKSASSQADLNAAVNTDKKVNVSLSEGNYTMPTTTGDVTISGTKATIITVNDITANKVAFNGVTVKSSGNAYTGIKHSNTVVYNDCVIVGNKYLYAENVVFNNCTFDLSTTSDYIWVYGATNVEFNSCTFNTMGKAILVFQDGSKVNQTVTVKGCTFNATAPAYNYDKTIHIAAVSMDGSQGGTYNVILENNTVDTDFNGLWQDKTAAGNITVTVDGTTVLKP